MTKPPLLYEKEHWVTINEACELFMLTRRTIERHIATGKVRSMKPLRTRYVYIPDLETRRQ